MRIDTPMRNFPGVTEDIQMMVQDGHYKDHHHSISSIAHDISHMQDVIFDQ